MFQRIALFAAFLMLLVSSVSRTALAQAQSYDWMVGQWNLAMTCCGWAPRTGAASFVRNGNEIRLVSGDTYLLRGVTDPFGVTSWQVWIPPHPVPSCTSMSGGQGHWIDASNVAINSGQRQIDFDVPMRDGGNCMRLSNDFMHYTLTR